MKKKINVLQDYSVQWQNYYYFSYIFVSLKLLKLVKKK